MKTLIEEFGGRLVTLNGGAQGLRGGMRCEVKAVDDVGDDAVLDFIATDQSIDRYNEVIRLDGWDVKNYLANPVVPDCHDYSSIAKILGRTVTLRIADGKMMNRVKFAIDNPLGNLAYKMARDGFIRSESVGFIPLEWTNGMGNDQPDRTYTKQELLEISLVVVPANAGATVAAMRKSGTLETSDIRDLRDFIETICSGETEPGSKVGASGAGLHDAQLLQLARDLSQALGRV